MKNHGLRILICAFFLCVCLLTMPTAVQAADAEQLDLRTTIAQHNLFYNVDALVDENPRTVGHYGAGAWMNLKDEKGIGSVYIQFDKEYGQFTVINNDTGKSVVFGQYSYLNEFVDMEETFGTVPKSVTITFDHDQAHLAGVRVYGPGEVPDDVQKWLPPAEGDTDLLIFSCHADDEQLFFAGTIPYYAIEKGFKVQIVYFTNHRNLTTERTHEALNGLWAVGIRNYPISGTFPDYYTHNKQDAYMLLKNSGIPKEKMEAFVVEQVRRFKPKVVLGHDVNGEYDHGSHQVYSELVQNAVNISSDSSQYPESVQAYGTYDVPKTYLHLYSENQIVMDWDQPLESLGGLTPYMFTKTYGAAAHASQKEDFDSFMTPYDSAAEMAQFSCREFGLYRTTVGPDEAKNDFFENVLSYTDEIRLAEEEARRAEEEAKRLAEEEAARKAAQEKAEQEAYDRRTADRQESEQLAETISTARNRLPILAVAAGAVLLLVSTFLCAIGKRKD